MHLTELIVNDRDDLTM